MKNLIKLGIVVVFLAWGTESFAQIVGLKGGVNLADMLVKDDEETYSDEYKMNTGFHFGPTLEFPVNELFSFETGFLLSTKGMKASDEETSMGQSMEFKEKINLYYLDIPLTAKVYFGTGNTRFFGTFGPYLGVGLSGKAKSEYTWNGETEKDESDLHFGSDEEEDDLKQLDYGISAGLGVTLNAVEIGITYNYGLANIAIVSENGIKVNNRVLGISLGYKFARNTNTQTDQR